MPLEGNAFSLDSSGKGYQGRRGGGRKVLLLGTSLLVYAAMPSAALAQNECGPPPPGEGSTVTCTAAGSPYVNGISYPNVVEDLTVVLEPGTQSGQTVNITSTTVGVDLRLEGQTNTFISSNQNGFGAGEGVNVTSARGTVFVGVDDVLTTGTTAQGINAASRGGTEVVADFVSTLGADSRGVVATSSGSLGYAAGPVSVTTNAVFTQGNNSDGIIATAGGSKYGGGDVSVTSGILVTTGVDSDGIIATANEGSKYGDAGSVFVGSGSLSTLGDASAGIEALSEGGSVTIDSGALSTQGANSAGISATIVGGAGTGVVNITSDSVSTLGAGSAGISANAGAGTIYIDSGTVATSGANSGGISAVSTGNNVTVASVSVTTLGAGSTGINASAGGYSLATVTSGTVSTSGANSVGINAYGGANVSVTSGTVTTLGANSAGIIVVQGNPQGSPQPPGPPVDGDPPPPPPEELAAPAGPAAVIGVGPGVVIVSGTSTTAGANSPAVSGTSIDGFVQITSNTATTTGAASGGVIADAFTDVQITSGTVSTSGANSTGITASAYYGYVDLHSIIVTTTGANSGGIVAVTGGPLEGSGDVMIDSGAVTTSGVNSNGIVALAGLGTNSTGGNVRITSVTVTTSGANSLGVGVLAYGDITIGSGSVSTTGANGIGISAYSYYGNVSITSANVTTTGAASRGIYAYSSDGNVTVTSTGTVATGGAGSDGIYAVAVGGSAAVTSNVVTTNGNLAAGIDARAYGAGGNVAVTSANVTTTGPAATGIYAFSDDGNVTVTSSGTVRTGGQGSPGIYALGAVQVRVTSATVVTTGISSSGIVAIQDGAAPGLLNVTSGSVTTGSTTAIGIDALAANANLVVTSTGAIITTGAGSTGIRANSVLGSSTIDVNNLSVAGTATDGILVTSATTSNVTVRGLATSANGFVIQANGGATTLAITASGTIRGRIDLTGNADTMNNAGTFDVIGTSLFGAGADVVNNSGTVRSTNGAGVLGGLETFNNSGRVELRDNVVGDTLNVTGAFIGTTANSRLGVDVDLGANLADVLITGAATGTTILDVNLLNNSVLNLAGTLVVDAAAGTNANAFTLAGGINNNPYVALSLLFDAPNNNFLLVSSPGQPVFETVAQAAMVTDFWYQGADAISAQLEAARDGLVPLGTTNVGNLAGNGSLGGWVQVLAGNIERDATQSFTNGGGTTVFDTSYEQDFQGVQGGLDYQSGGTIIGVSFGVGKSDAAFDVTLNPVELDGYNMAAYVAFNSGSFFFNALAKMDWVDVESSPGAGVSTKYDATAWGLRGTAGFRFDMNNLYVEPSVTLSWVNVDIDDYSSNGATITFDDITSFRGAAGVRFGGDFATGGGTFSPFVGIYAIEEFSGDARSNFILGQTVAIAQDAPGTYGELTLGLNYSTGRLEVFARGELDFGGERDGLAGRAGLRLRF